MQLQKLFCPNVLRQLSTLTALWSAQVKLLICCQSILLIFGKGEWGFCFLRLGLCDAENCLVILVNLVAPNCGVLAGSYYSSAKKSLTKHGEASKRVDLEDEWLIYISKQHSKCTFV